MRAFDSGSRQSTREQLVELKLLLLRHKKLELEAKSDKGITPMHAPEVASNSPLLSPTRGADQPGPPAESYLTMKTSPISPVTWPHRARELAGIPETAINFCYSYPYTSSTLELVAAINKIGCRTDPFVLFLTVGAYIFFDFKHNIVHICSLAFFEMTPEQVWQAQALCAPGTPGRRLRTGADIPSARAPPSPPRMPQCPAHACIRTPLPRCFVVLEKPAHVAALARKRANTNPALRPPSLPPPSCAATCR